MRTMMARLILAFLACFIVGTALIATMLLSLRDQVATDVRNASWGERVAMAVLYFERQPSGTEFAVGEVIAASRIEAPTDGGAMSSNERVWAARVSERLDRPGVVIRRVSCGAQPCAEIDVPSVGAATHVRLVWAGDLPGILPPWPALASAFVLMCAIGLGGALFMRSVGRQLRDLAGAAEALGEDFRGPALPEQGPEELERLARALNVMRSRLMRHVDAQSRVLAALSHDLRTPVTRLRLVTELLGERGKGIEEDVAEIDALVKSSLEALQGGPSVVLHERVDLAGLLERLVDEYRRAAKPASLGRVNAGTDIMGDPYAVKRCLRNVIENALKFGESARVSLLREAEHVVVVVEDSGPGIPAESLEKVFAPFFRLETSRSRETGGMGLGLSIALDIAQAHGGAVTLENVVPRGLRATVRFKPIG